MNRLEDRLRDAFGAAAETLRPDAVASMAGRPSAASTRRLAPLTAAAAVAVVLVGASVITPLVLAGGQHAHSSASGGAQSSPAASASPPGALLVVPEMIGLQVIQAEAGLQAVGLRITVAWEVTGKAPTDTVLSENPPAGAKVAVNAIVTITISAGPGPSVTYTLAPSRLVTVSPYAVTIRIPRNWRRTRGLASGVVYSGTSGWVQLQAVTERSGLHAACAGVAARIVGQYGRHPFIGHRRIDGRPGCVIPAKLVNGGTVPWMTSVLVEYRSPISGGANFLLISADPATMSGIIASIRLHH